MPTMDAMVTGRMPAGKKEMGNGILKGLGMTASQAINELYDYLIAHGQMPCGAATQAKSPKLLEEAAAHVDSFPFVQLDGEYATMTAREARMERLSRRHGCAPGADCGARA